MKQSKQVYLKQHVAIAIYLIVSISTNVINAAPYNSRSMAAFDFPSFPTFLTPNVQSSKFDVTAKKKALLSAISNTNNGKTASTEVQRQVLNLVREIEKNDPPPVDVLSSPEQAQKLDGIWYLQYTSPSEIKDENEVETTANDVIEDQWTAINAAEGASKIETRAFNAKGSISAQGISVDTSNKPVLQIFDIEKSQVRNEVKLDFGKVIVGGAFRQSESVPNRAIVAFNYGSIQFDFGFTLKLDAVFKILATLRGTADNGWLETTFLSDDMRIGRGNKGTMFVLTRNFDDVQP